MGRLSFRPVQLAATRVEMSAVGPLCQENPRAARLAVMQELRAAAGQWRQGVRLSSVSIATPKTWFLQCAS